MHWIVASEAPDLGERKALRLADRVAAVFHLSFFDLDKACADR